MLSRILQIALLLVAIALVCGAFFAIYTAMSPGVGGGPGLLTSSTPFPTAQSLEDIPLGLYLQARSGQLYAPVGTDPTPVMFTVTPGQLPADVASDLAQQGLISDADLFVKMVKYLHVGSKIQAGDYILKRTMTMDDIIESLQHGRSKTVAVTIRPGWRAEQVAEYLGTLGLTNITQAQFLQAVKAGRTDYPLLTDRPKGASTSLEGYLYPETYFVPYDISVDSLLMLIEKTFDQDVTDKMLQESAASRMTFYEVITLASIVEREAAVPSERATIASVYLNRLKKRQFLQADPTVQYAMGYQAATQQWWKTPVTLEEYQGVKSPYNTYLNGGLPPGPISSPSLDSIMAVLEPAQTDYLYFLGKGDGTHVFAKTYEEHQQNMIKYGYSK